MKDYIKIILSLVSKLKSFLLFAAGGGKTGKVSLPALFYKSYFSLKGTGNRLLVSGRTEKTHFFMDGSGNTINFSDAEIARSIITLTGTNNSFSCEDGVVLRDSVVTIRGNNCSVKIGKASTFGGVRIISAGTGNEITIGAGCLFADFIEVWGSDTHPIYNDKNEIINPEKPICIGDKVWVGTRATILKGVTIASGSMVGMGSLVINDVPESCITAGSPNRIIKENVHWSLHY